MEFPFNHNGWVDTMTTTAVPQSKVSTFALDTTLDIYDAQVDNQSAKTAEVTDDYYYIVNGSSSFYQCRHCDKRVGLKNSLIRHVRSRHSGERPYRCQYTDCDKSFALLQYLKDHEKTHTGVTPYECSVCGKRFKQNGDMHRHIRNKHSEGGAKAYSCELCSQRFKHPGDLTRHRNSVHTEGKPFHCAQCDARYKTNKDLRRHQRNAHSAVTQVNDIDETLPVNDITSLNIPSASNIPVSNSISETYSCKVCSRVLSNKNSLLRHMTLSHSDRKPFTCRYCNKAFAIMQYLREHERIHSGVRPYSCSLCDKTFVQNGDMHRHVRNVHRSQVENGVGDGATLVHENSDDGGDDDTSRGAANGDGQVILQKFPEATLHIEHLGFSDDENDDVAMPLDAVASNSGGESHDEQCIMVCDRCNVSFTDKSIWRSHVLTSHPGRCHVCEACAQIFVDLGDLVSHACLQLHKSGTVLHQCSHCTDAYTTLTQLRKHQQDAHDQAEMYPCHVCDSYFLLLPSLERHMATHNGINSGVVAGGILQNLLACGNEGPKLSNEESMECPVCLLILPSRSALKQHTLERHSGPPPAAMTRSIPGTEFGGGTLLCPVCGCSYSRRSSLTRHMFEVHGEENDVRLIPALKRKAAIVEQKPNGKFFKIEDAAKESVKIVSSTTNAQNEARVQVVTIAPPPPAKETEEAIGLKSSEDERTDESMDHDANVNELMKQTTIDIGSSTYKVGLKFIYTIPLYVHVYGECSVLFCVVSFRY